MRYWPRYLWKAFAALATAAADVATLSLDNGFLLSEAIAFGISTAHVALAATWAVLSRRHLWLRGVAAVVSVLAVTLAIEVWSRPPLEFGGYFIRAASFAGWAILAGGLAAVLTPPRRLPTASPADEGPATRRQFGIKHLLALTTWLAVVLALTRPLALSGGAAAFFLLLTSTAIFVSCLLPHRLLHSPLPRAFLSAALLFFAFLVISATDFAPLRGAIAFVLPQGVLYVMWLEVILGSRSAADRSTASAAWGANPIRPQAELR